MCSRGASIPRYDCHEWKTQNCRNVTKKSTHLPAGKVSESRAQCLDAQRSTDAGMTGLHVAFAPSASEIELQAAVDGLSY